MKEGAIVGVRELRTHLSAYLRQVKDGKVIVVGERRRPIARLVPAAQDSTAHRIADLAARGLVTPGSGKPGAQRRIKPARRRALADIVIEDRR